MIEENAHIVMHDTIQLLKEQEEYSNSEILYVLINNKDIKESISVVLTNNEELYEVKLKNKEINYLMDWDYNFDDEIFANLEKEYDIGYMNMEVHYAIWSNLEEIGIEEIEHKIGLQKYLKFCKENNIDKKAIDKKLGKEVADAMKYYDSKNDFVVIENNEVKIPRKIYQKENDIDYIKFCLGYDLLNGMLSKSETSECDISYDFCDYLARKFVKTDYYKNEFKSTYDNLQEWINNNKDIIKSEHLCFSGLDDKAIIEFGKRGKTPVALVEHYFKDGTKEYIVAFNYEIKNNKTEWGYGYYYSDDIKKAKEDFERVKAGKSLADTFEEKNGNKKRNSKGKER